MTDAGHAADSQVEHGDVLIAFTEAIVGDDDRALVETRERVVKTLGPEAMVDAAGVASNFMRMVRIADSTGIPLDATLAAMTQDVREELHLDHFSGAQNTEREAVAEP